MHLGGLLERKCLEEREWGETLLVRTKLGEGKLGTRVPFYILNFTITRETGVLQSLGGQTPVSPPPVITRGSSTGRTRNRGGRAHGAGDLGSRRDVSADKRTGKYDPGILRGTHFRFT